MLLSYAEGRPTHSAEATGYMLRGFFEALRRHIAIEEELSTALRSTAEAGLAARSAEPGAARGGFSEFEADFRTGAS